MSLYKLPGTTNNASNTNTTNNNATSNNNSNKTSRSMQHDLIFRSSLLTDSSHLSMRGNGGGLGGAQGGAQGGQGSSTTANQHQQNHELSQKATMSRAHKLLLGNQSSLNNLIANNSRQTSITASNPDHMSVVDGDNSGGGCTGTSETKNTARSRRKMPFKHNFNYNSVTLAGIYQARKLEQQQQLELEQKEQMVENVSKFNLKKESFKSLGGNCATAPATTNSNSNNHNNPSNELILSTVKVVNDYVNNFERNRRGSQNTIPNRVFLAQSFRHMRANMKDKQDTNNTNGRGGTFTNYHNTSSINYNQRLKPLRYVPSQGPQVMKNCIGIIREPESVDMSGRLREVYEYKLKLLETKLNRPTSDIFNGDDDDETTTTEDEEENENNRTINNNDRDSADVPILDINLNHLNHNKSSATFRSQLSSPTGAN